MQMREMHGFLKSREGPDILEVPCILTLPPQFKTAKIVVDEFILHKQLNNFNVYTHIYINALQCNDAFHKTVIEFSFS